MSINCAWPPCWIQSEHFSFKVPLVFTAAMKLHVHLLRTLSGKCLEHVMNAVPVFFLLQALLVRERACTAAQYPEPFAEALARFPVSHVLVSNGVVNITTLPSFRRMFTKQCHRALAHTSSSQLLVNTKMYSSLNILINLWLQQQCLQQRQLRQRQQQRLLQHPQQQDRWHLLYFHLKIMTINKWNQLKLCLMIKYLMQKILR